MTVRFIGLMLLVAVIAGCGQKTDPGKVGPPLPPSKEVKLKGSKGKMVLDEMPPPPPRK
jgi:hypothetical protein